MKDRDWITRAKIMVLTHGSPPGAHWPGCNHGHRLHPRRGHWVRLRSDGSKDEATFAGWRMDLSSPYPEEWFLPQVEEMLRDYDADGLWVDGDCWHSIPATPIACSGPSANRPD